jgi:hypothetical protein
MTEQAQKIWEAFCGELIQEPTDDMKEALSTALREVVKRHGRVSGMVYCNDILDIANELEAL